MTPSSHSIELQLEGMHCSACALGIEKHLKKLGISDACVNFGSSSAQFSLSQENLLPKVINEIENLGYKVKTTPSLPRHKFSVSSLEGKFLFCLFWTLPLLLHMLFPFHLFHNPYFQLFLCIPVFILGIHHFGRSAFFSLRSGYTNMDVLITLSITAAFIYSLTGTLLGLGPDFLFYETSATITTIVLFGNLLEERAIRKTSSAIEELSKLRPPRAKKISYDKEQEIIQEVAVEEIQNGDVIFVNEGDRIPVDAEILTGAALLDESLLSGESLPVEKTIGDRVVGGTIVIQGNLRISASAVGEETVLANMIKLVRQAQSQRPALQRIGDKVSAVFVPGVALFAIATFLVSYFLISIGFQDSLLRSIAVLVIACPCALGIATPTAVMVGVGQAARHGVLIRGGDTLERLAKIKTIIFDKTGTLTDGKFKIRSIWNSNGNAEVLKSIVLSLTKHSSHPIATSLNVALANVIPFEFVSVEEKRGIGIVGKDDKENTYKLGGKGVLPLNLPPFSLIKPSDLFIIKNEEVIGGICIEDQVKPESPYVIKTLQQKGIHTVLLSGDKKDKCDALADRLGIKEVFSEQLPQAKLKLIEKLEAQSETAFVGDGINDAPALTRASVGVSLSNASHIAIESAKVLLLDGKLNHLLYALSISKATYSVMKENLFWAFFYNILAIPAAASGYLSPMLAALAMAFSDVIVILNSLRLKSKRIFIN